MNHNTTKISGAAEQYKSMKLAEKLQDEYPSVARAYSNGTTVWAYMEVDSSGESNPVLPSLTEDMLAEGYVIDYVRFDGTLTFVPVEELSE